MRHGIQKQIAEKAGITPAFLNAIIKQGARPAWKTAKRLATVTGTNPILWVEGSPQQIIDAIENMEPPLMKAG